MKKEIESVGKTAGVFIVRLLLGGLFLFQGFHIMFDTGIDTAFSDIAISPSPNLVPVSLIKFAVYFISIIELFAGFFLLIGLLRRYAIYSLGTILLFIYLGFSSTQPVWNYNFLAFEATMLFALLFLPLEWDRWSVDNITEIRIR